DGAGGFVVQSHRVFRLVLLLAARSSGVEEFDAGVPLHGPAARVVAHSVRPHRGSGAAPPPETAPSSGGSAAVGPAEAEPLCDRAPARLHPGGGGSPPDGPSFAADHALP